MKRIQSFFSIALLIAATQLLFSACEDQSDEEVPEIIVTKGRVTDIEGNEYVTVKFNNIEWMAENLRTTKYRNDQPLAQYQNDTTWGETKNGAFAHPNGNTNAAKEYGLLYNAHAFLSPQGLCPVGWRMPTKEEFTALVDLVGGLGEAGGNLKSTRTSPDPQPRWELPNEGATDQVEFGALPAGIRYPDGNYNYYGLRTSFWTSSMDQYENPYFYSVHAENKIVGVATTLKNAGFSVRCVKD